MYRKKNNSSLVVVALLIMMISGTLYVYNSALFERELPKISLNTNGYWSLKKPLYLKLSDASGIKEYSVSIKTSSGEKNLYNEVFVESRTKLDLQIDPPRSAYAMKDKTVKIIVKVRDASKWNFLKGNEVKKEFEFIVDKKRPMLSSVSHSYKISKGGSALVILKVKDENLADVYVETSFKKIFKVEPFYKDGYYITLLAWPVTEASFKATLVAVDKAGNKSRSYIPLYIKNKRYRVSKINLSDKFLKGKIAELADEFVETQGIEDSIEQFITINEDVRAKNEKLIHKITSEVPSEMISDFKIHKLYPLKNAQVVASFGDHRKYFYDGKFISESYHLGLDLASNAMAVIKPQNGGDVVFADFNGLYGNMPIISHGLGLYTLYGHCSSLKVNRGDYVNAGTDIANTGKSGYAMGDHLHFGVLVQGVEVRPAEWMDKTWIKLNITNIIKKAKVIIDRN